MMKKTTIMTAIAVCCLTLFASMQTMAEMPGSDPKALWEYMTKTSPYAQWKFWDDHQGMLPGDEPHGSFHKVYVNDIAYASTSAPMKNGSVIVKENYNDKKKLMALTVIYKVEGYNPDAGDWFWVRYTPEGKAKPQGKVKGCISCHSGNQESDFIFVHEFK